MNIDVLSLELYCLYAGSKVLVNATLESDLYDTITVTNEVCTVVGLSFTNDKQIRILGDSIPESRRVHISKCKLILHDLKDFTLDEAKDLAKILGFNEYNSSNVFGDYVKRTYIDNYINKGNHQYMSKAVIDYLRASEYDGKYKKSYDVDGLIGNCAINANDLLTNQAE